MESFFNWFTGGDNFVYQTLIHCMNADMTWIILYLALCVGVTIAYSLIGIDWFTQARRIQASGAKQAVMSLNLMTLIFIFCALSGYAFVILKTFWPAYRLVVIFLAILNIVSFWYVLQRRGTHIADYLVEAEKTILVQRQQIDILKSELNKDSHKFLTDDMAPASDSMLDVAPDGDD